MLTQEQINAITTYCENKGVKYYDVQLELVDHIADIVKNIQESNRELSFNEALELAGKQFADDEFEMIVNSKKRQLLRRFKRLWCEEFISYFTIPKVTITMCLVAFVVWASHLKNLEKLPMALLQVFSIVSIGYGFGKSKIIKQNKEDRMLRLIILDVLDNRNRLLLIPMLGYIFLMFRDMFEFSPYPKFVYEIGLYFFPLFVLIALAWRKVYVDQNILLRDQYPQAFAF